MTAADIRLRFQELGLDLPAATAPQAAYVPAVHHNGLVWVSGQLPFVEGKLAYAGKVDADVSLEHAQHAAKLCAVNAVAALADALGHAGRVVRIVRVGGYVASSSGFAKQPLVVNGASELLHEVFGDAGQHARAAIGAAELPINTPVELELTAAVAGL